MKIFVCVKQVPDTESKIRLKSDSSGIDETGIKWVLNPYDEFGLEEALKLKESQPGSSVTVLSLGPKKTCHRCYSHGSGNGCR
jgi:electron transfer flavoprotein beta subunit